jgi:ComF family protein
MTSILETITSIIAPHSCFVCGDENNMLCKKCAAVAASLYKQNCFMCGLARPGYAACELCAPRSVLKSLYVLGLYAPPLDYLVGQLKYQGVRQFAADAAVALADITNPAKPAVVTYVPTSARRMRVRSYDQAALLARHYAKHIGAPLIPLVERRGNQHQVGADHATRLAQAETMLQLRSVSAAKAIAGAHVYIVDDVYTTGASLGRCAALLDRFDPKQINGVVIARQMNNS